MPTFISNPMPIIAVHSDDPPYDTSISGMPVIGSTPIAMPMFTTVWNRIIATTPAAISVANGSRAAYMITRPRASTTANSNSTSAPPRKPDSSARIEKMKSVLCCGR